MGAEPVRTCAGCRERRPQGALIRVAERPDGTVGTDPAGHGRWGRGAYVCGDPRCIEKALSSGGLRRALRLTRDLPEGLRVELLARVDRG